MTVPLWWFILVCVWAYAATVLAAMFFCRHADATEELGEAAKSLEWHKTQLNRRKHAVAATDEQDAKEKLTRIADHPLMTWPPRLDP